MCLCKPEVRTPWCDDCQSFAYQSIKELKSTVLDLHSELARKKMSLTVACNRVEELEDKLSKCQEIAMGLGIKYNEQQDKLKIAISALKRVDNILYEHNATEMSNLVYDALEKIKKVLLEAHDAAS